MMSEVCHGAILNNKDKNKNKTTIHIILVSRSLMKQPLDLVCSY
jgi:hypothetical protein